MIYKAIVADDEKELRVYLNSLLSQIWPDLEICGEAANGEEVINLVESEHPHITFLDIKMPGLTGMEAAKKIAGFEPNEMIDKQFTNFVPKKEMAKYFKVLKNALAGTEIGSFESFVYHKDGHLIPVEFDGKIVTKDKKSIVLGTIKDINERKENEKALQKAYDELARIFPILKNSIQLHCRS